MSFAEFLVIFKGSLLILSQLSSCGLWRRRSIFCSPQQLTHAISGHKGYCQHLTHSLSSRTRPYKEALREMHPSKSRDETESAATGSTMRTPLVIMDRRWCRAEESPDIPECPITLQSIIISWLRGERKVTSLSSLTLGGLGAGVARSIKSNQHRRTERMTWRWKMGMEAEERVWSYW